MAEDDFRRRISGGAYRTSRYPATVGGYVDPQTGNLSAAPAGSPTAPTPLPQPVAEARNRLFDVSTNPRAQFAESAGKSDGPADTGIGNPNSAFGKAVLGGLSLASTLGIPGIGPVGTFGKAIGMAADHFSEAEEAEAADAEALGPGNNPAPGGLADLGFAVPGDGFGAGTSEAGPPGGFGPGMGSDPGIGSAVGDAASNGDDGNAPGGGNDAGGVGAYARGGRPPVGQPAIVGEHGPELFVPDRPGTVVPNHALSGAERLSRVVSATDAIQRAFASRRAAEVGRAAGNRLMGVWSA